MASARSLDQLLHSLSQPPVWGLPLAAGAGLGEAGMVFLPDLAVSALGMTAQASSYVLVPVVLALAVGSPGFGRMLDRHGPKPIVLLVAGALVAAMAVAGLGLANRRPA